MILGKDEKKDDEDKEPSSFTFYVVDKEKLNGDPVNSKAYQLLTWCRNNRNLEDSVWKIHF